MKKLYSLILFAFITVNVFAQSGSRIKPIEAQIQNLHSESVQFEKQSIFSIDNQTLQRAIQMQSTVRNATVLNLNKATLASILASQPNTIEIAIPMFQGVITLELFKVNIFSDDFSVVTASNNQAFEYHDGVHYRGVVKGQTNTIAAISIFNDEVMGFVSYNSRNYVIGKLENDDNSRHIFYAETDLQASPSTQCYTADDGRSYTNDQLRNGSNSTQTIKCVRLYWETNYDVFQGKGSVVNVTNYATGLFNQSATIYSNDGISVTLSQIFVWNIASPYTSTTTSGLLTQFKNNRTSFNGDLANLLGYAGGGGIAAGFSGLCNSNIQNSMCYSGIQSSYNTVPVYSWSVEVATHEQGHLLGSRHTHACVWNGNSTAIDGCGPSAGYGYEGSCSGAPIPAGGGTIMSYCHLTSVGINFTLGFGSQPQTVIVNNINNGACLPICGSTACGIPSGLYTNNITPTSATLNWLSVANSVSYAVRYRKTSSVNWNNTSTATNSLSISGLTLGSTYEWQARTICSIDTSAYSASATFIASLSYCNSIGQTIDGLTNVSFNTINNTTSATTAGYTDYTATQSTTVLQGNTYSLIVRISTGGNYTNFAKAWIDWNQDGIFSTSSEEYNLGSATNVIDGISSLSPLTVLVPAGAAIGSTRMRVSTQYSIMPTPCNASFDGEVEDYTVVVVSGITCQTPSGLSTTGITNTSATLSWASTGANSYNLQWRESTSVPWKTISGLINTTYDLLPLNACTSYEFQVQGVCSSNSSLYSASRSFTTTGCVIPYCSSAGTNTSLEYINRVVLGTINNISGNNNGYADFTAQSTNLVGGVAKTISMYPGFTGTSRTEAWRVYIDYNHNGLFTDAGERVASGASKSTVTRTFTVPITALNGPTRMRVQMKYTSYATSSCATFASGEVEDYTINITGNPASPAMEGSPFMTDLFSKNNNANLVLFPNPANDFINLDFSATKEGLSDISIYNIIGQNVVKLNYMFVEGENLLRINTAELSKGIYLLEISISNEIIRQKFTIND